MPPVTKVEDQLQLVSTKQFPFGQWKFEEFNPIQSRVMDFYDKETSGLIAASTSGGKTVVAEMFLAQEIRKRGGKGMFLVPLRSLARQNMNVWSDKSYHFGDLKISICTGDFRLTKERMKELADADLIIMTYEMLSARCRNYSSEQNDFLKQIGTLVIDESHSIGAENRGAHLEVGLMKFTAINPTARLVLLSATMPNIEEIADWVSYSLTKRDTFMLRSKYRPVPLTVHYEPYEDEARRYQLVEQEKINKAMEIIEWYKDDKFIVFSHTKGTGEMMKTALRAAGIEAYFHNADLEGDERAKIEDKFKDDPNLKVIVATSTLSAGLNFPARRVIILGYHRGLSELKPSMIIQMSGRAGRLGLDKMGDAYILVPESKERECRLKFKEPERIESQLLEKVGDHHKDLAFHLVSEIHHGDIKTSEDVTEWYKKSLAYFQNKSLQDLAITRTVELLKRCGAIADEEGMLVARPIGKVASMFYFSPFDASDLYFNFKNMFAKNAEGDDYALSLALGNIDSQRMNIVSKAEKDEMSAYASKVRIMNGYLTDAAIKSSFCYFNLLNGINSQACIANQRGLQFDFNRVSQVLQALDSFAGMWGKTTFFKDLESRITNGVPAHLIDLCRVPNVGKVRATRLFDFGIKTVEAFADTDFAVLKKVLAGTRIKDETLQELVKDAKKIALVG